MLIDRHGREIAIEDSASPIRDRQGRPIGAVLVFHDVTESRRMQREIEFQATHDTLTGLMSRRAFDRRLRELTEQALGGEGQHILVYIDLDQFKVVNDTAGHAAGDELLRQVAALFQRQVRESDFLARLGGDEFGLLLVGCGRDRGTAIAEKIRERLADLRFGWGGQVFQIGASFGIAAIDRDLPDPNALGFADLACYTAKEQGRNRIHHYHPGDAELATRRSEMHWVARIESAIDRDRFVLYGQRILPLQEAPAGWERREALVRMQDDDGEPVPPGQFIPAAERYGIMPSIDLLVVQKACDWLQRPENAAVQLSVNLSGTSLGDPLILCAILRCLERRPDLGPRLCFEIAETAASANLSEALVFMERLRALKVSFALDDFGSGLSSFGYLKTLPVSYLKIDGGLVRDLLEDPVDAAMVESIDRIAKALGIETIAELVESRPVLERLREIGVDYGQGFWIERPSPLD